MSTSKATFLHQTKRTRDLRAPPPVAALAVTTLIGCYDGVLVNIDTLPADTEAVEFRLTDGKQTCVLTRSANGKSSFYLPLSCSTADLTSASQFQLRVRPLSAGSSCASSQAEAVVKPLRLGFWPDEVTVNPDLLSTPRCSLTIKLQGPEYGHIASNPPGISCPGVCSADFDSGTLVSLTATPRYQVRWQRGQGLTGAMQLQLARRDEIGAAFVPGLCTGDNFCLHNPISQRRTFRTMASVSGEGVWLAGDGGTVAFFDGRAIAAVDSGTESDLHGIATSKDGRVVWAVGDSGTILTFAGSAWTPVPLSSGTRELLRAVWISNEGRHVWIAGDNGTVLHYEGDSAESMQRGTPRGLTKMEIPQSPTLYTVWGQNESDVWVAGDGRSLYHYETGRFVPKMPSSLSTTFHGMAGQDSEGTVVGDAGGILRRINTSFSGENSHTTNDLYAVWRSSSGMWATGRYGTVLNLPQGSTLDWTPQQVSTTANFFAGAEINGIEGSPQMLIAGSSGALRAYRQGSWEPIDVTSNLRDVWASSANDIWAVGDSAILHLSNGVITLPALPVPRSALNSIWGSSASSLWAVGDGGLIIHSEDGIRWEQQNSGSSSDLRAVCGTGPEDIWAVGTKTTVLHYSGQNRLGWEPQGVHSDLPAQVSLNGVWCGPANEVWFAGDQGVLIRYKDGTFQKYNPTKQHLLSVWGDGNGNIYAAGLAGTLVFGKADGDRWIVKTKPNIDFYRVAGASDGQRVLAVGTQGSVLSLDADANITTLTSGRSEQLFGVSWSSAGSAWLVGQGGLLVSYSPR